jgi:dTDP-4-dehydrorhamnose 3,5-epimerase
MPAQSGQPAPSPQPAQPPGHAGTGSAEPPALEPLSIEGTWLFTPKVFGDSRGAFFEWVRGAQFEQTVGHRLRVAQANCSISRAGAVRGIHLAATPPGQAKYVTCLRGRVTDVVVDLRRGSPTFGQHELVELGEDGPGAHRALYVSEGLGHGFVAHSDDTLFCYLVSEPYNPDAEFGVHPFDADLGIDWPSGLELTLSDKDAAAPSLRAVTDAGRLPDFEECRRFRAGLADRHG